MTILYSLTDQRIEIILMIYNDNAFSWRQDYTNLTNILADFFKVGI